MEKLTEVDNPLISELQQTIQSLRELLEKSSRAAKKEQTHLENNHIASESALKQTIINLRAQVTTTEFQKNEQDAQFEHSKSQFQNEKDEADKHFQSHMFEVRSHFEQNIQKLQQSAQQQKQRHQAEVEDLQIQIKQLRKQIEKRPSNAN